MIDEVGELVLTAAAAVDAAVFLGRAMPAQTAPTGRGGGAACAESYFSMYPGVWRHGDWIKITPARRSGDLRPLGLDDQPSGRAHGHERDLPRGRRVPEVLDALVVDVPTLPGGRIAGETAS